MGSASHPVPQLKDARGSGEIALYNFFFPLQKRDALFCVAPSAKLAL